MKVTHSMRERQFPAETDTTTEARDTTHQQHSLPLTKTLLNSLQRQQLQTPSRHRRPRRSQGARLTHVTGELHPGLDVSTVRAAAV
jgi:hypothetical protein